MKFPKTHFKIKSSTRILIAILAIGSAPAMAQDDGSIPILPGIEDMGTPGGASKENTEIPETYSPPYASSANVTVGQMPVVIDESGAGGAVMPPQDKLIIPQEEDPAAKALAAINQSGVDDNLFYDADSLVPTGEFTENSGTVKVNPRTQPASRFVIVNKNSSSNSTKARLVSASRATKLGRYDSALEIYDALYAHNKTDPQILMGRALSLQHLGRIDEALMAYNDFLDRKPKDINARVNMLGLMVQKYPSVALRHLLELYEGNRNNVGVIAQIAVTYARMGQTEEALKYFGMAAGMEPNNPGHIYNMAIAVDQAGDKASAISLYEKALEIDAMNGSGSVPRDVIYERLAQLR